MNTEMICYVKPPLGLVPRFIVVEKRTVEILEAMIRYASAGYRIPQEWREELDYLLDETQWKVIEGVEDAKKKRS